MITANQASFNPVDFRFQWTQDGWYEWDSAGARSDAMRARNAQARAWTKAGHKVRKWSVAGQRITRGGIGTPNPEVDFIVTVFGCSIVAG